MIIRVDQEGQEAVTDLCDVALKRHGMGVVKGVLMVLNSIQSIQEELDGNTDDCIDAGPVDEEGS